MPLHYITLNQFSSLQDKPKYETIVVAKLWFLGTNNAWFKNYIQLLPGRLRHSQESSSVNVTGLFLYHPRLLTSQNFNL